MTAINSMINADLYIKILDNFLLPSIENWFGNDEFIGIWEDSILQTISINCYSGKLKPLW